MVLNLHRHFFRVLKRQREKSFRIILKKWKFMNMYDVSYRNVREIYIHKRLINIQLLFACQIPSGLLKRSQNLLSSAGSISNPFPPFTNSRLTAAGG